VLGCLGGGNRINPVFKQKVALQNCIEKAVLGSCLNLLNFKNSSPPCWFLVCSSDLIDMDTFASHQGNRRKIHEAPFLLFVCFPPFRTPWIVLISFFSPRIVKMLDLLDWRYRWPNRVATPSVSIYFIASNPAHSLKPPRPDASCPHIIPNRSTPKKR
jgi:hypothetical protein